MSYCTACGGEVLLAKTEAGVSVELNPEPVPLGFLFISAVDGKVKPWKATTGRSVERFDAHGYTCPEEVDDEA